MGEPHVDALAKAKIQLMHPDGAKGQNNPIFYSSIIFGLKQIWTDHPQLPTAATDGKRLWINIVYFLGLAEYFRISLLAHEASHVAQFHHTRFKDIEAAYTEFSLKVKHKIWNYAADHVINLQLRKAHYPIHPDWLCDDRFMGMGTEQVFKILYQEALDKGMTEADYDPTCDLIMPSHDDTMEGDNARRELENFIASTVGKAFVQSEMFGENQTTLPPGFKRELHKITNPKLPFTEILRNHLSAHGADDYSYEHPDWRFMPEYYVPSAYSERLCNFYFFFDVSGSVDNHQASQVVGELGHIKETLNPEKIELVEWDDTIVSARTIDDSTDVNDIDFHGGGNTLIGPVIDYINTHQPELSLIITDGYFNWYGEKTNHSVIWCVYNNPDFAPPFGEVVHFDID